MGAEEFSTGEAVAEGLILEAKMLVPAPRAEWVLRRSLVEELERAGGARLTLISAPVGSGKSTLVAQWAAAHERSVAWLTLDSGDDTPTVFWMYFVAALRRMEPTFGESVLRRLRAPGAAVADDVLPLLANALFELGPATLVLDDFQAIASEEIQEGLLFVIERLPPGVRIVIVTQADPRFGLTRLRARGDLWEIRALGFSVEESAALLRHALGIELSVDEVRAIHGRTEGWAAGLQLAALSARDQADPVAFLVNRTSENRYVVDLMWEEVLARQHPEVRRFLVDLSILDRFSASLCAAVSGRRDAEALLLELERGNLFLVNLDPGGEWHRFHQLFRQALARRRAELLPDELADLHRRASEWYAAHGQPAEAIEHALQAGDVHFATDELARQWLALFSEGRAMTMFGWLERLPFEVVAVHPSLCLLASGLAYSLGRLETAEYWLGVFDMRSRRADELLGSPLTPETAAANIRGMLALARGDLAQALTHARRAYGMALELSRIVVGHFLGVILFYADDDDAAEPLLRRCLTDERTAGYHPHAVTALACLSAIALDRSDAGHARQLAGEALERARAHDLEEYALTSVAESAFGAVLAVQGDLDEAEEHLERAVALARRSGQGYEVSLAHLQLAGERLRHRDREGARAALAAARGQQDAATLPRLVRLDHEVTRALGLTRRQTSSRDPAGELTAAELDVLRLLPTDLTYPEIAQRLFISINTLKTHTSRIRRKLGVASRSEAVATARIRGLL